MKTFSAADLATPDEGPKRWLIHTERTRIASLVLDGSVQVPVHAHAESDELFYFITGRARVRDEHGEFLAGPGDAVALEPGTFHTIDVVEGPVLLLAIVAPNVDDTRQRDAL